MNLLEDLVADLQKENLLDDGAGERIVFTDEWISSNTSRTESTSKPVFNEVSAFNGSSQIKRFKVEEVFPETTPPKPNSLQSLTPSISSKNDPLLPLSPVKPKKLQKVHIKSRRKSRFCKTCMIKVPYYRVNCRFCGQMVTGRLFYYSVILFSVLTLLTLFFAIVSSRK